MNLHTLKPATGSKKGKKRIGRGQGSGRGGTATRGHKGAKSRSGYSQKLGFEGGQMPLQRRVPKFGFKNPNRVAYKVFNLDFIAKIAEEKFISEFTPEVFINMNLMDEGDKVKILGRGVVSGALSITANAFSETAKNAIEAAGGTVAVVS